MRSVFPETTINMLADATDNPSATHISSAIKSIVTYKNLSVSNSKTCAYTLLCDVETCLNEFSWSWS